MSDVVDYTEVPYLQEILNYLPIDPADEEDVINYIPEYYQPHCGKLQIWAISVCVFWSSSSLYDLYLLYGVENRAN